MPKSTHGREEADSIPLDGIAFASCANTIKSCSELFVDGRQGEHELTGSYWVPQNAKRRVNLSTGRTVQVEYF
jgi:hypothetical protein